MKISRRTLLRSATGLSLSYPLWKSRALWARPNQAKRIIFFYFPDGVVGRSESGSDTLWHASGSGNSLILPSQIQALEPYQDQCLFLNGISLAVNGSAGGHPDGAMRLLTAAKHANHISIDQHLASTVGSASPWRHLYLGVQATKETAIMGDHLSFPVPGGSVPPQNDPRIAFCDLFGRAYDNGNSCIDMRQTQQKAIDSSMVELNSLRSQLGGVEAQKLEQHLESLNELQYRLQTLSSTIEEAQCTEKTLSIGGLENGDIRDPSLYPDILRAQTDLMVLAMECGLTKVGLIQNSYHTSDLIMSRFPGTPMFNLNNDVPSHEASHYGANHDDDNPLYTAFFQQRAWWVEQYAYLLEQLSIRPEDGGSMLDNSIVVLCSEVSDGNTHSFDNMPFILSGAGAGTLQTGRAVEFNKRPHADLWITLAKAMGEDLSSFGEDSTGILSEILNS